MLLGEHSAILLTFIKLPFSIKTFVLSIFKWPHKTGFTAVTFLRTKLPNFDLCIHILSFFFYQILMSVEYRLVSVLMATVSTRRECSVVSVTLALSVL